MKVSIAIATLLVAVVAFVSVDNIYGHTISSKEAKDLDFFIPPPIEVKPSNNWIIVNHMTKNNLDEDTAQEYAHYILDSATTHGVDPLLVLSVMHVETGGTFKFADHPNHAGAIGLMQILDSNAKGFGVTVEQLYDPEINIERGTWYLGILQEEFGHDLGIIAYNQGGGNVKRGTYKTWYLDKVLNVYNNLELSK